MRERPCPLLPRPLPRRFVSSRNPAVPPGKLVDILARSRCPKARLLHYFPTDGTAAASDSGAADNWCGWHLDHGSLTGDGRCMKRVLHYTVSVWRCCIASWVHVPFHMHTSREHIML